MYRSVSVHVIFGIVRRRSTDFGSANTTIHSDAKSRNDSPADAPTERERETSALYVFAMNSNRLIPNDSLIASNRCRCSEEDAEGEGSDDDDDSMVSDTSNVVGLTAVLEVCFDMPLS